jgi:hypothetical protein
MQVVKSILMRVAKGGGAMRSILMRVVKGEGYTNAGGEESTNTDGEEYTNAGGGEGSWSYTQSHRVSACVLVC